MPALARSTPDTSRAPQAKGRHIVTETPLTAVGFIESVWDSPIRHRHGNRALLLLALILLVTPIVMWLQYESTHVISTNAIVRGHVAELGSRLDGVVASVEVDAGDRVVSGQILLRLEDHHFLVTIRELHAALDALELKLEIEKLEIAHAQQLLNQRLVEASANVSAAEAETTAAAIRADEARRTYELRRDLFAESGAISGEDVLHAESNRRTSEAMLKASEAQQIAALSGRNKTQLETDALAIRERQVKILEADIARAQAQLERAELNLDSTRILAPTNGAIVRRIVQTGGSVNLGQPVISMWLGTDAWIEAWIDESDIAELAVGDPATVTLVAFPDREFAGTVTKIGLTTDFEMPEEAVPQPRFTRMRGAPVVGVRVDLESPPNELLPGLSAVVAISTSPRSAH